MVLEVWQSEEALFHDRCGTYQWEWEENAKAYEWGFSTCRGCMEVDAGMDSLSREMRQARENPNTNRDGWSIRLYPEGASDGE